MAVSRNIKVMQMPKSTSQQNQNGGVWGRTGHAGSHSLLGDLQIEMVDFILGNFNRKCGKTASNQGLTTGKIQHRRKPLPSPSASYTDQVLMELKTTTQLTIRNPKVMASNVDELKMPFEPMKMSLCEI
jgi:hypothetical protein